MGGALTDAITIVVVVAVLLALAVAALAARRYLLERSGGTVECAYRAVRSPDAPAPGWRLGVLAYQRDALHWHGAFGVLLRPEQDFNRRALTVVSRRPVTAAEAITLGADRIVVELAVKAATDESGTPASEHIELAMTDQALTGFLAWLEASPPGSHLLEFS